MSVPRPRSHTADSTRRRPLAATRPETDPSAAALRARMHVRRGRYAEAEQLLAPVAGDEPFGVAGLEYGLLLIGTGRSAEAGPYLDAVIDLGSQSRRALDRYRGGVAAGALGRYRDGERVSACGRAGVAQ